MHRKGDVITFQHLPRLKRAEIADLQQDTKGGRAG